MTTRAAPIFCGSAAKNSCSALMPPAEAPIPATVRRGQEILSWSSAVSAMAALWNRRSVRLKTSRFPVVPLARQLNTKFAGDANRVRPGTAPERQEIIHRIFQFWPCYCGRSLLRLIRRLVNLMVGKALLGAFLDQPITLERQAAAQYRRRAEELRAISATYNNPQTNRVLEAIARDYERMAANLETLSPVTST